MKRSGWLAGIMAGLLMAGVATAGFSGPEEAIAYRKSVMTLIVHHLKQMGAELQGKEAFDKADFVNDAKTLQMLTKLPWEAFMVAGSDRGDTSMNSNVFSESAKFAEIAENLEGSAETLANVSASGELEKIRTAFGAVAENCKNCHGRFRSK